MTRTAQRRVCTALTRRGRPCRSWAMPGTDPPLCGPHAGLHARPPVRAEDRCSYLTRSGRPCRSWAVHGSRPPACPVHSGLNLPAWQRPDSSASADGSSPGDDRRCTHRSPAGRRCARWAAPGADPPLCPVHAGLGGLPWDCRPGNARCQSLTIAGRQCLYPALPDTQPPTCAVHAGLWSRPGAPPGNRYGLQHGAYSRSLWAGVPEIAAAAEAAGLHTEIVVLRVITLRLLESLNRAESLRAEGKASGSAFVGIARAILRNVRAIAGLVVEQAAADAKAASQQAFERSLLDMAEQIAQLEARTAGPNPP